MQRHQTNETARTHRPTPRPARLVAVVILATMMTGAMPAGASAETPAATPTPTPTPMPVATAAAVVASTGTVALGDLVTFYGRGYGHGVGLSQYGARGRALAGQDAASILAHYYQGTVLSPIDPATRIRVLVQSKWLGSATRPLVIHGRLASWSITAAGGTGLDATILAGPFPADARMQLLPTSTVTVLGVPPVWRLVVDDPSGAVLFDGFAPTEFTLRSDADAGRLQLTSRATRYNQYRGTLRVVVHSATRVSVINDLGIDAYLGGVVPVEMPSTWSAAALQAQAVAARSYAARRLRPGISYFDVADNSTSQIYRGILVEKATTNAAIAATAGLVLMSGATVVNALFHSTGGGATESNENVYTSTSGRRTARPVSYLRGGPDRADDGVAFDARAPYATWSTRTYGRAQLSAWFAADVRTNVGDLFALDLHDRGVSGRVVSVTLIGSMGSRTVSGEVFRAAFNAHRPVTDPSLKSTLLDLAPIP